jgi:transcriptional regulator with XRE-family HTH domain
MTTKKQQRLPIFAERLRWLRKETGLSQYAFSQMIGVANMSVVYYENGDRLPDAEIISRIAKAADVSSDWLLGLTDVKSVSPAVHDVCNFTGLTEAAVEVLHFLNSDSTALGHITLSLLNDAIEKLKNCGRYEGEADYVSLAIFIDNFKDVLHHFTAVKIQFSPTRLTPLNYWTRKSCFGDLLKVRVSFLDIYDLKRTKLKKTLHDYVDTIIEDLDGEAATSEYVIRMRAIDYLEKHNSDKTGKEESREWRSGKTAVTQTGQDQSVKRSVVRKGM